MTHRTSVHPWCTTLLALAILSGGALACRRDAAPPPRAQAPAPQGTAAPSTTAGAQTTPPPGDGGPVQQGLPEAAVARPAELAILAPLRIGAQAEGWTIEHISRAVNGRILVYVRRGAERATYGIMLNGPGTESLLRAGKYVVYMHGTSVAAAFPVGPVIVDALNHHQDAPTPEGMSVFSTAPVPQRP